jgi:hypothetical protein
MNLKANIMKKLAIYSIFGLMTAQAHANNNYLLKPGEYIIHRVELDSTSFIAGKDGKDVNWNFATSDPGDQFIMKVSQADESPFYSKFSNADIVVVNEFWSMGKDSLDANYHYYGTNGNDLVKFGRVDYDVNGQDVIVNQFLDPEAQMNRPLYYQAQNNDYWHTSFEVPSRGETVEWKNGINYYEVDGVGTLDILGHKVENVYRITRYRSYTEAAQSSGNHQMSMTMYEWYHVSHNFPIATLIKRENAFDNSKTYHAYYIDEVQLGSLGIEKEYAPVIQSLYPNPASNSLNLSYELPSSGQVRISIRDLNGRIVQEVLNEEQYSGIQQQSIALDLKPGQYLIQITGADFNEARPVVVI